MAKTEGTDLTKNLEKLSAIADWFDSQEKIDVEEGLKKVKDAAALIKQSKVRLNEIENEFEIIQRDIEAGGEDNSTEAKVLS